MTPCVRCGTWASAPWLFTLLVWSAPVGRAQEKPVNPFDAAPAADAARPGPDAATDEAAAEETPAETDPLILAILESERTSPQQQLQAAATLLRLNRSDLARPILKELLDADLEPRTLFQLQRRFGSALFLRMALNESLQPEGAALAEAVRQAAATFGQDPQRLARLVEQLTSSDPAVARTATAELQRAGVAAVPPLVRSLAEPQSAPQEQAVRSTLRALGSQAVDPLVAALQAADPALRVRVADLLGRLQSRRAVAALLGPALAADADANVRDAARQALERILSGVPSREEATRYLQGRIDELLEGEPPGRPDEDDRILTWSWDPQAGAPVSERMPMADATVAAAAAASAQLVRIAPDDARHVQLHLATGLEAAQRQAGFDQTLTAAEHPLVAEAAAADLQTLERVLVLARQERLSGAALATLRILEQKGDASLLRSTDGQPTAVVLALTDPDRRVRYAAARVLVKLDPQQAYPGNSYLVDGLAYLASSGGQPNVLIAHPKTEAARNLAALLNTLGLETRIVTTGRDLLRTVAADPGIAFILLSDAMPRTGYTELLQVLRHETRTAELPIGVIVRDIRAPRVQRLAEEDPLTLPFALPLTDADMALETQRLIELAGRQWIPPQERIAQATFALETMTDWAEQPETYRFYELLAHEQEILRALSVPALTGAAAKLLGILATPAAQRALVDFASDVTRPAADRKAAAQAFRQAVQQRRLLLTRADVLRQYERYNSSRNLDPETQQILGSILDAIEGPTREQDPGGQQPDQAP